MKRVPDIDRHSVKMPSDTFVCSSLTAFHIPHRSRSFCWQVSRMSCDLNEASIYARIADNPLSLDLCRCYRWRFSRQVVCSTRRYHSQFFLDISVRFYNQILRIYNISYMTYSFARIDSYVKVICMFNWIIPQERPSLQTESSLFLRLKREQNFIEVFFQRNACFLSVTNNYGSLCKVSSIERFLSVAWWK